MKQNRKRLKIGIIFKSHVFSVISTGFHDVQRDRIKVNINIQNICQRAIDRKFLLEMMFICDFSLLNGRYTM